MSIIHRLEEEEIEEATTAQTYATLGERDTPDLYQQGYKLDFEHDCPTGGGNSLDRKTKYIDRDLYQEVMDGEFKATGLEPKQIIRLWCDHEHTEKCNADGDNRVDFYTPCHKRGLRKEHEGVTLILGPRKIKLYETTIWPGLVRCYQKKKIVKPPKDYWCGPLNDDPQERDEELLEILQRLGVVDAFKHGKHAAGYGYGVHTCDTCRFFSPEYLSQQGGRLAACKVVSGLIRADRGSDYWQPKEAA
jgi:hypothetical protein